MKDIEAAFASMAQRRHDVFIVLQDALTLQHRSEIIDFAIRERLPGMFVAKEWVELGGLMSYGESLPEMYRRGAYFVDRILKGANPADLPVEQVTKFELVLNLKTAKATQSGPSAAKFAMMHKGPLDVVGVGLVVGPGERSGETASHYRP